MFKTLRGIDPKTLVKPAIKSIPQKENNIKYSTKETLNLMAEREYEKKRPRSMRMVHEAANDFHRPTVKILLD